MVAASLVAARRFPIVDEEAGKIRTIYAAMYYPPPEMPVPNWPPYDGNWPLPATFSQ